jgi:hypothetical protein
MKITEKISGRSFTVYAIYWSIDKTYFLYFPARSGGLSSIAEDEMEINDPSIDNDFEYVRTDERISGFFHKHLLGENLMDDLLDHDPVAYKKFVSLIGKEP